MVERIEDARKTERETALALAARSQVGEVTRVPNLADQEAKALVIKQERKELGRIDSRPKYLKLIELTKRVKGCYREMEELADPFVDVYRYHTDQARKWKNERVEPLKADEKEWKAEYTAWEDEQARIEEAARRKAQAEQDAKDAAERARVEAELHKAQEERLAIERKAEADRAAAARAIAEAQAKQAAAEAKQAAAEATTKKAQAAAERMAADAKAAKVAELKRIDDEAKATAARLETERLQGIEDAKRQAEDQVQGKIVEMDSRIPHAEGKSRRDAWSARMVDRIAFVKWLAAQPNDVIAEYTTEKVVLAFLVPLNQLAKAQKRAMHVDGVQAVSETIQSLNRTRKPNDDDTQGAAVGA